MLHINTLYRIPNLIEIINIQLSDERVIIAMLKVFWQNQQSKLTNIKYYK
jgi:hypothetical protein